jgi:hypothetical protein
VSDVLFMVFDFYLAAWLPAWLTIVTALRSRFSSA